MVGAGLLARNAVARGLSVSPTVKTSLAPGSRAVTEYLRRPDSWSRSSSSASALVGYGCTTCIGNSGPLDEPVAKAVEDERAGRRGRPVRQPQLRGPHPSAGACQLPGLAAPGRRVCAGGPRRHRPHDRAARPRPATASRSARRHLAGRRGDPSAIRDSLDPELFRRHLRERVRRRRPVASAAGAARVTGTPGTSVDVRRAAAVLRRASPPNRRRSATSRAPRRWRCWATRSPPTTSRRPGRSPPGARPASGCRSTASAPLEFNSYGARRGHHEVMMRGTFGNIRLRNALDGEGRAVHDPPARRRRDVHLRRRHALPGGRRAADRARRPRVRLGLVAGLGRQGHAPARRSRRDRARATSASIAPTWSAWACCRSSSCRANRRSLGLTGREASTSSASPTASARASWSRCASTPMTGETAHFQAISRLDGPIEVDYYRQGGILPAVLRRLAHA